MAYVKKEVKEFTDQQKMEFLESLKVYTPSPWLIGEIKKVEEAERNSGPKFKPVVKMFMGEVVEIYESTAVAAEDNDVKHWTMAEAIRKNKTLGEYTYHFEENLTN